MCGFFLHTKQFFNTTCVSYNSTQFWSYLPGVHIRSHRLRAQSHETATYYPLLQMSIESPGCYLCFWLTGYKSEIPKNPFLGLINFLEWLTKLRTPVYLPDYQFITKDIKGYKLGEEIHMVRSWMQEFLALWHGVVEFGGQHGSMLMCCGSPTWKVSQPNLFGFFLEVEFHRHDWLNHWPLVLELNL